MKNITYCDIQTLLEQNIDTTSIIDEIDFLMRKEYPNYHEWFNNKLIPGLENNTRNIICLFKNHKIIGFVNLKKTNKERKMSNIYIKSTIFYEKCWNLMIDEAIKWLDDENPVMIVTQKDMMKSAYLIKSRNWHLTDKTKTNDYIINRCDEFEIIKRKSKIKRLQY